MIEEELIKSNKLKNFFSEEIFFAISDLIGRDLYKNITPEMITERLVNSVNSTSVIENVKRMYKEKNYENWEDVYKNLSFFSLFETYFIKNHHILDDLGSIGYHNFTTSYSKENKDVTKILYLIYFLFILYFYLFLFILIYFNLF